jgi:TRAP-type mannitol/chloroaromatic compound transport system permease large subunit
MAMVYLLGALLLFALLGIPLAFSIGASSITYMFAQAPNFLQMLPQRVWNGVFSELMIAMPLFMLAGELMNGGASPSASSTSAASCFAPSTAAWARSTCWRP